MWVTAVSTPVRLPDIGDRRRGILMLGSQGGYQRVLSFNGHYLGAAFFSHADDVLGHDAPQSD